MKNFLFLIVVSTFLISCARVGSPVGGKKDSLAPKFLFSNIDSSKVNVPASTKELRLYFDKYITLKDITKNLTISPPIKNIKKILPNSLANKYILVQWEDSLKANTTYNFNFGNAIADNNEGNVLSYFNYAFSTGDHLDDLYISGEVKDGLKIKDSKESKPIVVGLYPDSDSIDYKQKPYYITKADDDGYFELNYLSPGTYKLIAFQDENANSVYDSGKEKIGFIKDALHIEKSISGLKLAVFPSKKQVKFKEAKAVLGGVLFLYEGHPEHVKIESLTEKLKEYRVSHLPKSDTAMVWFDAKTQNIGVDSPEGIKFSYQADAQPQKETSITYRYQSKDDLTLNSEETELAPNEDFKINSNYFVKELNTEKWSLKVDSLITQAFTATVSPTNPYQILVKSDFKSGKKYQLTVPKETISSFYKSNSKSYLWDISADGIEQYGKLTVNLSPVPAVPFWVKLFDSANTVKYSKKAETSEVVFDIVKPGTYFMKIFIDENKNGQWDEADFETKIHAEPVKIYYKPVLVKALWEMVEPWDLNDNRTLETSSTEANSGLGTEAKDRAKPQNRPVHNNQPKREPGKLKMKN
ncbi:Ig-like domain-containing protein [Amniculibacterium sp. G2-70]|uniref:Ig-like domain-containing protein n=1 Tax=Amniculibacterium sp. G2-70 TaxID=2767188 RepID=UPI0016544F47|nr:Ig-like domain-containing domain [Amniculibacterium sp. G2-70]